MKAPHHRDTLRLTVCLIALLCALAACSKPEDPAVTDTAPVTAPAETDAESLAPPPPDTDAPVESEETAPETHPETEPTVSATVYPTAALPDYAQYTSDARIERVLSARASCALTVGGDKAYRNGVLTAAPAEALTRDQKGVLRVSGSAVAALTGKTGIPDGTPEEVGAALGMSVTVYDGKLVLFAEGEAPLSTYSDLYTLEAMQLAMTGADEEERRNALIDLPARISNNTSNTVFYTDPDLNLGVQTSVYFAQMGQLTAVDAGPALVAGEGEHASNFTTVRIFNEQQTLVTQFLAFGAEVTGGVQVAAARVGEETLIATAAYAAHDGRAGDIRVFDRFGLLRMTISLSDELAGPYTVVTGRLSPDSDDEVLLIAPRRTDAAGKLPCILLSLSDGRVLARHELGSDLPADTAVALSVRRNADTDDTLVAYVHATQSVYEGTVGGELPRVSVTLPADAIGVSPSGLAGERYTVSLPEREDTADRSFLGVVGTDSDTTAEQDVGFRENRFYSALYTGGFNDDKYVSRGDFCHVRTDLYSNAILRIPSGNGDAVGNYFAGLSYRDFACWDIRGYADRLATDYLFLEPCFSHRWLKTDYTNNLAAATDPVTGERIYVSMGRDGTYSEYHEVGVNYHIGTYADGILDLAKLRLYPLRSFLQGTVEAFRGEGANPEHLVGVSPVHEHEIHVPGSAGDYNTAMIVGFRLHLLDRYGSVGSINQAFGTAFSSLAELDPPRGQGRGTWDNYEGAYYNEWCLYNRSIVSKRIMEAYREALLAGYPPEAISAHQMPEGEAVPSFLGAATDRLTPVDIALSCGTAYGGTRYGTVYHDSYNLVRFANRIGHESITLGEYCARTYEKGTAHTQLRDFWSRGLRMVHHVSLGDAGFEAAEAYAVRELEKENSPRPGYTGGTSGSLDVGQGTDAYRIVQIGEGGGSKKQGLLKSVDAQGSWEGTVYLVPFHTQMAVTDLPAIATPTEGQPNRYSTGVLSTVKNADQVEVTLTAASVTPGATLTFAVYHKGNCLAQSVTAYTLTDTATPYRYVLSNQLYEEGLEVVITVTDASGGTSMEGITLSDLTATLQTERADFYYYNGTSALRNCLAHVGGVSFDLLDRE